MPNDEPEVVYHYTTMDAMMKIVESRSIWASSVDYLNDKQEGEYFLQKIKGRMEEILKKDFKSNDKSILRSFVNSTNRDFRIHPFVVSFSAAGDSLPLWRSYCHGKNCVAIGFKTSCLNELKYTGQNEESSFARVEYGATKSDNEYSKKELDRYIAIALQAINRHYPQGIMDRLDDIPILFEYMLNQKAYLKKHPSFSNEREYRIIAPPIRSHTKLLEFRECKTTLIPYVRLQIPEQFESTYLSEVRVGPTGDRELSRQAVRAFLNAHDFKIRVKTSKSPYRDL